MRLHPILLVLLAMLLAAVGWVQLAGAQGVVFGDRALVPERAAVPAASRRVALIVGNGAYGSVERLINPASDARLMANTLRVAGFELVGGGAQLDLSKAQFDQAIQAFGRAIAGADVAMFYYSGHGMQVDGTNWLVPVEANPTRPGDLDFQMVNSNLVLRQMEDAGTKLNIMVLDACRNNPFAVRGVKGTTRGLAEMRAPEGTVISYATQPGNVALDGADGNSPYTTALAEAIHRPGLDVFQVFNQVGLSVKQATGGRQQPWLASSPIAGAFQFFAGVGQAPAPAPSVDADSVFWQAVQGSRIAGEYEEYLRRFPNGVFAGLARRRIEALSVPAASPGTALVEPPRSAPSQPSPPSEPPPSPAAPSLGLPSPGPPSPGPERTVTNLGRWTTRSVTDCERSYYTWRALADLHEFTDQSGQTDTERVINRWPGGMMTETTASKRRTGAGMPQGTRWSYTILPSGQIRVLNTSTQATFVLTRCPG